MATNSASHEADSLWTTPQFQLRYGLVVLYIMSQLIAVVLTWPLRQVITG